MRGRAQADPCRTQHDQLADNHKWEDELFEYVKTFDGEGYTKRN
jgi:hypothetical protein